VNKSTPVVRLGTTFFLANPGGGGTILITLSLDDDIINISLKWVLHAVSLIAGRPLNVWMDHTGGLSSGRWRDELEELTSV